MKPIRSEIAALLSQSLNQALGAPYSGDALTSFETPPDEKFGDLSSHLAMRAAKERKTAPRTLAEEVRRRFVEAARGTGLDQRIASVTVEGPGFLNFFFSPKEIASVLGRVHEEGAAFGKPKIQSKRIILEFVSANPTGPLTVAHGRQAALGDSLALILSFCGHTVHREYYNNDEGVQIQILGKSIQSRYLEETGASVTFPEEGYKGEYIRQMARDLIQKYGKTKAGEPTEFFCRYGKETILEGIQKDLKDFGVTFDRYYSQEALMKSGEVERTLEELKKKGFVYEKEGAVWFESTRLGDDKDRVLVKSDKSYTYLTPDIAYHKDKFSRKFEFLINILGPDHHGYIPRIKAAVEALGHDRESLQVLIAQLVTLFEGEKTLRMSTRAGEFVTLREILDEVGRDAGRFFFLMRKFDAHLDFDLALAKSQTLDNPVFYIQYAHARIESIKNTHAEKGGRLSWSGDGCLERLTHPSEIQILRQIARFEDCLVAAERTLEPFRLVPYLRELAGAFHRFYTENRVVTDDAELTQARMRLVVSTQSVLRIGLSLLGISSPVKM